MKTLGTRWLGRAFVVLLVGALAVPVAAAPSTAAGFSDVPGNHQFYSQITWLAGEGVTTGYSDGTFRPKESISREAMAAFLHRLAGEPEVALPSTSPFTDVASGSQFYREIVWLADTGITTGYSDGTFRPKDRISREAMAAFLYRYEGEPAFTPPSTSPFKDMTPSSKFYKEVTWLASTGIATGYSSDGTFRPKTDVSREATAAFLYRLSGSPEVPSPIPASFSVSGSGWGHGVGMSQYGAWEMAKDGYGAGEILQHYYQGTSVTTVEAERDLRVEIFGSGSDNTNTVRLVVRSPGAGNDGQWRMRFYNTGSTTPHAEWTGTKDELLLVQREGSTVRVTRNNGQGATATASKDVSFHWEGTRYYQPGSSENAYVELVNANGSRTGVAHGQYRHGRIFITVPQSRLIVAVEVKLNTEYLYGVAEVPSSWHIDALQAQAIVARGYALRQAQTFSVNCNCHLYDDTRSQNYTGWLKESEGANAQWGDRWKSAVDMTSSAGGQNGKVLTHQGSIATTYYYSSSGGQTENSEHIWSAAIPYLRAVDDPYSRRSSNPKRNWTRTLTQAQAKAAFPQLSDVVQIQVTQRTGPGEYAAAHRVTATSSTGQTQAITGGDTIRIRIATGHSPWIWSITPNY